MGGHTTPTANDKLPVDALRVAFEGRRRGVSDMARLQAAELHNITDVLLQLLIELRERKG